MLVALLFAAACGDNDNNARSPAAPTATPSVVPTATCPAGIELHVQGSAVDLDVGWTGIGYDVPFHEGIVLPLDATCDAGTAGCGTCTLNASQRAEARPRRRCADDIRIVCSLDNPCPSGPCVDLLGPPLGLTTGGANSCTRNEIAALGTGSYDPATGSLTLPLTLRLTFYEGIDAGFPCPHCTGVTLGATGVCDAGPHQGESCVVDATDALFGNTSYDCSPNPGALLGFFDLPMQLTTGASRLEPTQQCVGEAFAGLPCYCPGQVAANLCNDGTCLLDAPDGDAVCRLGPVDGLCLADRFRGCLADSSCPTPGDFCRFTTRECSSAATETDGNTVPLERIGTPDPITPQLVSTFCVAAANSAVPNQGLGLPGPAAIRMPVRVVPIAR